METRKQIAAEKKRCNSHNCAQAILHTYADIAGISEDEAMNIAGAFGGGMGNMEGTCGALVGSGLVLYVTRDSPLTGFAAFYGVETKRLNEKVKRNPKRFAGEDFMFQLTKEELDELLSRSQFATMKKRRPIGFI